LFLKALPPVFFAVFAAALVWLLDPEMVEVRMGTAVSALLTQIFLQALLTSNIPDSDYLSMIDYIFFLCYILIFIVMLEVFFFCFIFIFVSIYVIHSFFLLFFLGNGFTSLIYDLDSICQGRT
jgi:hypothetical protein